MNRTYVISNPTVKPTSSERLPGPGEYAINELGTWHTADVQDEATVLFVTAGLDTQHRPR